MPRRSDLVVFASLLALLFTPLAVAGKDKGDDPVKIFEEKMKKAGEEERIKLIQGLAKNKDLKSDVKGKAISKYMSKGSTAVKVAAIKAVGDLKYKKSFGRLKSMI